MGVAVLGPVSVEGDAAVLGPRDRVVLAALALHLGETVTAEGLADALWGGRPPPTWPKVIQGCVARLRKVLGAAAIETVRQGYRLVLPVEEVDAQRFERLVGRARELLTLGEPDRAAHVIGEALALWRGRALVELEGWEPGQIEAARLEELRLDAQEVLVEAALRAGRYREVLSEVQARVAEAPLRERRWALLALAQYQAGRQGEALRTLHRARTVLASELGVDPGPDLVALEAAILRHDPSLVADVALPEPSATCPYLGLVAYDVGDAEGFFGRDADVAACLRRLATTGVLAVVGPSGSGKSSLVRAGVAAALGRDGRRVVVVTPGARPTDALTVLPTTGPAPVLVVDQCEEALTLCRDSAEQARFFAALVAHAERASLVVALRADRLGELSAHARFVRLIEPGLYLLGAMGEADLRAAIEGPAHQAGLLLEPGLVELLVREVEGEPGALPLLSHALRTTWERREGRTLTVDGYRDTGGIRGAVAQSAEQLYERVPPDQRPLVRHLLLRLVASSPDGAPVPSRLPRRIIATDPAHESLVEALVSARLITSDDGMVELAHEALARAWPRLRGWLDDDIEGQRILRHLTGAADTWDAMGRPDSELYRGARLARALDWRHRARPDLTPTEQAFLDAGQTLVDAERRAALDRARHQARTNQRLRALLAATTIFLVASIVVGSVAIDQRQRAERESRVASARELAAAATANLDTDPERSILLALEAVELVRSADPSVLPEAEEALHRAVTASRIVRSVPGVGGALDWSPDGTIFVTEGPEDTGLVDIRDARTGESVRSFHGHDVDMNDVVFSHDGSMLGTTGDDGAAKVWDPDTGEELGSLEGTPGSEVYGPSFSPDGSLFAASWGREGVTRVMDLGTGRTVREIRVDGADSTAFSPNGHQLAIVSWDEALVVAVDTGTGNKVFSLTGHKGPITDITWSPDGRWIATSSQDGSARIWDGDTGTLRFTLSGHRAWVQDVDWSPDSSRLATASDDGTAKVWRITEGGALELLSLSAQDLASGTLGVAFSPDGDQLMTGDESISAVKVWDVTLSGGAEWVNLPAVSLFPGSATFTPDGRRLVGSTAGGSATVWDSAKGARVLTFGPDGPWTDAEAADVFGIDALADGPSGADLLAIDVSPDGELIATASADGMAKVWDSATGDEMFTVPSGPSVTDMAWAPDGDVLATASVERGAGLVTIVGRSGEQLAVLPEEPGVAFGSIQFSPDGRQLLTSRVTAARPDPNLTEIRIWDWERGEVTRTIDAPAERAFYDPTGTRIGITTRPPVGDGRVEIRDSQTGHKIATLADDTTGVMDIAFAPDGSRVATAGFDGTVRLWDPDSGEQVLVLLGHRALVSSVEFSPDGSKLASVSADGTVRVWAIDLDNLREIAERELTRTLTDEECQQYLHQTRCPQD